MGETGLLNPAEQWTQLLAATPARQPPLLRFLAHQAQADGYSPLALAQVLDIPLSYLQQLYWGRREVAYARRDVIAAMGRYLRLAPVVVRCAAGGIRLADFFTEDSLDGATVKVRERLSCHAALLAAAPPIVQAFGGLLAGLPVPSRAILRNLVAEGPPGMTQH